MKPDASSVRRHRAGGRLDKTRLANLGAMIVATPDLASRPDLTAWFKGKALETFALPLRRTPKARERTYLYYFTTPAACP
jgi:hypothetical protein